MNLWAHDCSWIKKMRLCSWVSKLPLPRRLFVGYAFPDTSRGSEITREFLLPGSSRLNQCKQIYQGTEFLCNGVDYAENSGKEGLGEGKKRFLNLSLLSWGKILLHTVWGSCVKAEVAGCRVKSRYLFVLVWGFEDGIKAESPGSRREELWRQLEALSHLYDVLFSPQRNLCKTRIQVICFSVRFDPLSLPLLWNVSLSIPRLWLCNVPDLERDLLAQE